MKNKYQRMTKEEKKSCQRAYYNTPKGKEMKIRFTRLIVIGITGIIFSIFLIINGYLSQELSIGKLILACILTIFSIIYIVGSITLKGKCLNNFAIKNMKSTK